MHDANGSRDITENEGNTITVSLGDLQKQLREAEDLTPEIEEALSLGDVKKQLDLVEAEDLAPYLFRADITLKQTRKLIHDARAKLEQLLADLGPISAEVQAVAEAYTADLMARGLIITPEIEEALKKAAASAELRK
jgi:hypothetical protein